jgi:hypothetical protein
MNAKLAGYRDLAARTGITTPVLFWLPSARREAELADVVPVCCSCGVEFFVAFGQVFFEGNDLLVKLGDTPASSGRCHRRR